MMKYSLLRIADLSRLVANILVYVMLFVVVLYMFCNTIPDGYCFWGIPIVLIVCQLIRDYCVEPILYVLLHGVLWLFVLLVPFSYEEYHYLYLTILLIESIRSMYIWKMKAVPQYKDVSWFLPVCTCILYFAACEYEVGNYKLVIYYMGIAVLLLHFVRCFIAGLMKLMINPAQVTFIPMKKIIWSSILTFSFFSCLLVLLSVWIQYSNVDVFFSAVGNIVIKLLRLVFRWIAYIMTMTAMLGSDYSMQAEKEAATEELEEAVTDIQDPSLFIEVMKGCLAIVVILVIIYAVYCMLITVIRILNKRYVQDTDVVMESKKVDEKVTRTKKKESITSRLRKVFQNDNASKIRRTYRSRIESYKSFRLEKCDTTSDIEEQIYDIYNENIGELTKVYRKARYSNEEITIEDVKKGIL